MAGHVLRKPKLGSIDSFGPSFAPDYKKNGNID